MSAMGGGFVGGLIVGTLLGLILGPVLRSWLLWRDVESVRREASLSDALLDRLDRSGQRDGSGDDLDV
jgi:hypothetical protein